MEGRDNHSMLVNTQTDPLCAGDVSDDIPVHVTPLVHLRARQVGQIDLLILQDCNQGWALIRTGNFEFPAIFPPFLFLAPLAVLAGMGPMTSSSSSPSPGPSALILLLRSTASMAVRC